MRPTSIVAWGNANPQSSKKEKKKLRKKTATESEILGFDYKHIGDGMLNQSGHNDEV